jgi:hypothetical protein
MQKVTVRFGGLVAVSEVDFHVHPGELVGNAGSLGVGRPLPAEGGPQRLRLKREQAVTLQVAVCAVVAGDLKQVLGSLERTSGPLAAARVRTYTLTLEIEADERLTSRLMVGLVPVSVSTTEALEMEKVGTTGAATSLSTMVAVAVAAVRL